MLENMFLSRTRIKVSDLYEVYEKTFNQMYD